MKATLLAGTALTALLASAPAMAQIEEIVITAQKREQTLKELPVSVSVTSEATIEQAQIRDLLDLQTVAPSLRVSQLQSSANTTFIIRGFGNGANNVGVEPSVGVFIDGVFRSRSAGQISDLANVARVEILRGPQSTLFGKNASAGVINIVTQEPQFEYGGSFGITYGNFDAVVVEGDVTGPISDTVAFSVDGSYNRRDGYATIVNLNEDLNNRDRWNARGQLLWTPSDDLKFRLIGDYSKIDEICCFAGNVFAGPTVPALQALGATIDVNDPFTFNTGLNTLPENEIDNYGISLQGDYSTETLTFTSITSYRKLESFGNQDVDFSNADVVDQLTDQDLKTFTQEFRVASEFDGPFNFLLGGFYFNESVDQESSLTTGSQARQFFELLTGAPGTFAGVEALLGFPNNSIFSPGLLTDETLTLDNEALSIFGTVDFEVTDRLTLTAGFNYTTDQKDFAINLNALDPLANVNLVDVFLAGQAAQFIGAAAADPVALRQFVNSPAAAPLVAAATNPALNPLLALQPFQFQPPFVNIPNAVESGETDDDDFSYTLRATYEINDNFNTYFTYATGFKASSVNLSRDSRPTVADFTPGPFGSTLLAPASNILNAGLAVPNLATGTRFAGPEDAEVFELGFKAQFDYFNFNVALFDQTVDGFQSNAFTGTGFALANAGEQSTRGFEFDSTWNPTPPLVLTFAVTYLDAEFDSFPGSPTGDLTGQPVGGVAEWNIATSATYTHEFDSGAELIARVDYNHESNVDINNGLPTFNTALGNTEIFQREVNLLNAALTLRLTSGVELSIWGRNLTDSQFLTTVFDGVAQAGTVSGYPSQPRTYGATVRFRF
ncbi:TonB-dependent receptor [Kordiimonas sp. SCSIO 12610]|uniref:TonB-dependent receptor n=1 Tax=Kordiimonas sp. SCSIO 12610 TaxID=2829597 RepID=UPI00210C9FDC|nr:TonB-dependent receptor [Kordiimonas sp. SCSIO 12610]UTW55603.1 TonB-dependent receptor [Kordiimonas sp. SCSIO 12610]